MHDFLITTMTTRAKVVTWITVIILLLAAGFIYIKWCFIYSEGVNEGDINYFQKEGFVFKTYEGKMIQSGYNSRNAKATIQSNEFRFSVKDAHVAEQINNSPSRQMKLHWQRYLGTLPWRGNSQFVVDSIYSITPAESNTINNDVVDFPLTDQ